MIEVIYIRFRVSFVFKHYTFDNIKFSINTYHGIKGHFTVSSNCEKSVIANDTDKAR